MPSSTFAARRGITLVEILVVITIIGILAAITIPTVIGVIRNARQSALAIEIANLVEAIEQYKAARGDYPTDFYYVPTAAAPLSGQRAATIFPHMVTAYSRHAENLTNSAGANYWYDTPQHPRIAGNPSRFPRDLDPAEALVFWLSETADDTRLPLSRPDTQPDKTTKVYAPFEDDQLVDLDNDGWYEYMPKNGGRQAPFVYFNFRTYTAPTDPPTNPTGSDDTSPNQSPPAFYSHPVNDSPFSGHGVARPYRSDKPAEPGQVYAGEVYMNPTSFQIICAGLDENYGGAVDPALPNDPALAITQNRYFPIARNYGEGDDDNITNFSDALTLEANRP